MMLARPSATAFLAVLIVTALVAGVAGGLLRAGVVPPTELAGAWLPRAALGHAFLMICAFMGSVIGLERAVAVKRRWAFAAPLLSAAAGACLLAGLPMTGAWLCVLAAAVFVGVNAIVVQRQPELHTRLLLLGAGCWLAGNALYALGHDTDVVVPWWFSFLVLTIAAERLEMTRLMRRRPGASALLVALLGMLVAASALALVAPSAAQCVFGLALSGLAAWLLVYDIARRTVKAGGLSRYMAVCLLLGYGWLAAAGMAWMGLGLGRAPGGRDLALHGLALGFVFSMMLAHAPVIVPAVARIKLAYGSWFYGALAALHLSLLVRLAVPGMLPDGATANAAAIVLFVVTLAGSAVAWRRRARSSSGSSSSTSSRSRHVSDHP